MSVARAMLRRKAGAPSGSRSRRCWLRRGMSLIEVMLATVMLLACVMALSHVAYLARRHAVAAEDRTLSQTYCQNIMQEILAGMRPLASVPPESFEGDEWVYMVDVETVEQSQLVQVVVTVDRFDDPEAPLPTEDEIGGYRLVRWLRSARPATDMPLPDSRTDTQSPDNAADMDEPLQGTRSLSGQRRSTRKK